MSPRRPLVAGNWKLHLDHVAAVHVTSALCVQLRAMDMAGVGGIELPLEVSATDSYPSATDPSERRLAITARLSVSLTKVFAGEDLLCDTLERCMTVSRYLLDRAPAWLGE